MEKSFLDLRKTVNKDKKDTEVQEREIMLTQLGFSEELISTLKEESPTFFTGITEKIDNLKSLGFTKLHKIIERYPEILELTVESIKDKLENLKKLGFAEPHILVEKYPNIIGLKPESVKDQIDNLTKLGFSDPYTMAKKFPSLLGLNQESIKDKIDNLTGLGFKETHELIELNPSILGYKEESIKNKVAFYSKVAALYKLPITGNQILEYSPAAWNSKRARVLVLLSLYKNILKNTDINSSTINNILMKNLESTMIAYGELVHEKNEDENILYTELQALIKKVKARSLTKDQQQARIVELRPSLPQKAFDRYAKAYMAPKE